MACAERQFMYVRFFCAPAGTGAIPSNGADRRLGRQDARAEFLFKEPESHF